MTNTATLPVTLHVPEALVLEFQAGAVGLIEALMGGATGAAITPVGDDAWPLPAHEARGRSLWSSVTPRWGSADDDLERAVWVLKNSTKRTLRLIAALVRKAGGPITGDELAKEANYEWGARSVAPAFGAIGLRCRQVNRWAVWGWKAGESDEDASTYEMNEAVAELFSEALARLAPDQEEGGSEDQPNA